MVLAGALVGVAAGALAVVFRFALDRAQEVHGLLLAASRELGGLGWLGFAAAAALVGGIARWLVELAPETAGSGIPGVEARLAGGPPLRWRRLLPVKFLGGLTALATGMSLGREGPTVQMGAAAAEAIGEGASAAPRLRRALVAAGAGAGLSGAFDAPVAGFLFVIEELRCEPHPLTYATGLVATLCAQLVIRATFGPRPLFGDIDASDLPAAGLALAVLCGLVCGLGGTIYNRAVLAALALFDRLTAVPRWVHGAIGGLAAAAIGALVPDALFGGDPRAGKIIGGVALAGASPSLALAQLAAGKLVLTALSYGCGVVGGLFAPQLVIGAALGALVGELASPVAPGIAPALAGAGAAAFFTGSVRVPLTGVVLLLEMTSNINLAFPYALAAGAAYVVATALGNEPIYEALGRRAQRGR